MIEAITTNSKVYTKEELEVKEFDEIVKINKLVNVGKEEVVVFAGGGDLGGETEIQSNKRTPKTTVMLPNGIEFKEDKYIKKIIRKGFQEFFKYRVLPYDINSQTSIYFIGSIAHYFSDILESVANTHGLQITEVIQRPIDRLLAYHKNNINL